MKPVRMTRRVTFSAGHRYGYARLSDEENRLLFGPWASRYNHGHNYVLDVEVEGSVDPETGMVVNIKRVDDVLKAGILKKLDLKSLNDEVFEGSEEQPYFADRSPCLENLLPFLWRNLDRLPSECKLTRLRLQEMPGFYGEIDSHMNVTLTRTYEFAASHRLHAESLSPRRNLELYGKCNNPAGHGHNYVLEVTVGGTPNPETGFLCDLDALDETVHRLVVDRYDHKNLDVDVPELRGTITTSENVACAIFRALDGHLPAELRRIRLWETARNLFEVSR
jgi:6-pyruvoyltetrahydropterin/6-carboxytetrahydropterin synthase